MRTVSLGEVAEVVMGQAPPGNACNKLGKGTPFVKAGEFSTRYPVVREWTTNPLRQAKQGDVLVCVVGATAGKVNQGIDCAIGRSVAALRPRHDLVDSGYLYRFMCSQVMKLRNTSQGLAQGVVTRDMLKDLSLALPPVDEQRRIAAVLDKAADIAAKRREVLAGLDRLAQAIFDEMFGGGHETLVTPLGQICEVSSGITKGRRTNEDTESVPYLSVSNVQAGHLRMDAVKEIQATDLEIQRYALAYGDLVLTEGGDPDKLGRGTVWRDELPLCLHQNHIFRVRIRDENQVLPDYLAAYLADRKARAYLLRSAKQTTGIASINKTQLNSLPVTIPRISMQRQYVARLERRNAQRIAANRALSAHDELFAALQSYAFEDSL